MSNFYDYQWRWDRDGLFNSLRGHPVVYLNPETVDLFALTVFDVTRDEIFATMVNARGYHFMVDTIYPGNMERYLNDPSAARRVSDRVAKMNPNRRTRAWPIANLAIGIRATNDNEATRRLPILYRCPAPIRFAHFYPLDGFINYERTVWGDEYTATAAQPRADEIQTYRNPVRLLHWILTGTWLASTIGSEHLRHIVYQAEATGTPLYVRSVYDRNSGERNYEPSDWPNEFRIRMYPPEYKRKPMLPPTYDPAAPQRDGKILDIATWHADQPRPQSAKGMWIPLREGMEEMREVPPEDNEPDDHAPDCACPKCYNRNRYQWD